MNKSLFFLILVFFSLVKPIEGAAIKYYFVLSLVFIITTVFLFMMTRSRLWLTYWKTYRVEIVVFFGFLCSYFLSVLIHLNAYASGLEVVNYGTRTIVLCSVLFMAWVIFSERSPSESILPFFAVMIGLNAVALLQSFSYDSVRWLTLFFVSSDAIRFTDEFPDLHDWGGVSRVTSLFRWHTVYGVIAGLSVIYTVGVFIF